MTAGSIEELVHQAVSIGDTTARIAGLWYRGVSCREYSLHPGLLRDDKDVAAIFAREERLLTRFRQRSVAYWPSGYPQTNWEQLFAMQHYGAPTRLLDWSESLLASAHFALSGHGHEAGEHEGPCIPTVWCIDPVAWNRSAPVFSEYGESVTVLTTNEDSVDAYAPFCEKKRLKFPVAIYGTHNTERIVAQRGTFTVWGEETRDLKELAGDNPQNLWQVDLTGDKEQMLDQLRLTGFTETMVFPDLDSLAKELTRTEGWTDE